MPPYEQRLREACDVTSDQTDTEGLKYLSTGAIEETSPVLDDDHLLSKFESAAMLRTYRKLSRYVDSKWPHPNSSTHYSAPVSSQVNMSHLQDLPNGLRLKHFANALVHDAQIAELSNMNQGTTDHSKPNFGLVNRNPEVHEMRSFRNTAYPILEDQGLEDHIGWFLSHYYQRETPVSNSAEEWLGRKLFESVGVFTEGSVGLEDRLHEGN